MSSLFQKLKKDHEEDEELRQRLREETRTHEANNFLFMSNEAGFIIKGMAYPDTALSEDDGIPALFRTSEEKVLIAAFPLSLIMACVAGVVNKCEAEAEEDEEELWDRVLEALSTSVEEKIRNGEINDPFCITSDRKSAKSKENMLDASEVAERMVRELPVLDEGLSEASLFGVLATGETFHISSSPDLYELLKAEVETPLNIVGLAVSTGGWSAPLDADGEADCPPSEHPERKRVLLVAVVTAEEIMSAMRFADEDEIITDGNGTGAFADALREALGRIATGCDKGNAETSSIEIQIPSEVDITDDSQLGDVA